jgi:hypothetical protein
VGATSSLSELAKSVLVTNNGQAAPSESGATLDNTAF